MVLATASPAMRRELVEEEPQFLFEPPAAAGFIWQETLTIREGEVLQQHRAELTPDDHAESQIADAVRRAERDIEKYPRSARSYVNLGFSHLAGGNLGVALEAFDQARALDERNKTAALYAARALVLQGRMDEAEDRYKRLEDDDEFRGRVLMHLADLARRRGDLDSAIGLWNRAVEEEPDSAPAHANLGILLAGTRRLDQAIRHLRTATRLEMASPSLYLGLGIAYALSGQSGKAARSFTTAIQLAPRLTDAYNALAATLVQSSAYDEAEAVIVKLLEYAPGDFEGLQLMAEIAYRTRKYKRAVEWVSKALSVAPLDDRESRARLLNNRGVAASMAGQIGAAKQSLRDAVALEPPTPQAYYNLARLLLDGGDPESALTVLAKAADDFPNEPTGRLLKVVALESAERYDSAIEDLMRWVLEPDAPPDAWSALGQLLTDAKENPIAAIPALRDGAAKYPEDRQLGNNLAYALLMAHYDADARQVLQAVPEKSGTPDVADATLAATWGLLRLHEGDRVAGEAGYRAGMAIARIIGNESLALAAEQKMHLELARASLRNGDVDQAQSDVHAGLGVPATGLYHRHLARLLAALPVATERSRGTAST